MKNFFKKLMSSKSQSKYFSETVQRVGKNNAGFSLVELIVVIAIMAVLAAVAVIGVSIYVPKAQQAADKQLVSDVEQALNLYYQSHAGNMTGGYVIITTDDMQASGDAEDALNDAFGEGQWEGNKLAYEGWGVDDNMISILQGYLTSGNLDLIADSAYVSSCTDSLMTAVDSVLDEVTKVIARVPSEMVREIYILGILAPEGCTPEQQATANHVVKTLKDNNLMGDSTAISNILVGAMADTLGENTNLTKIMNEYAVVYAYAQDHPEDQGAKDALDKMTSNLSGGGLTYEMLTEGTETDILDWLYYDIPLKETEYNGIYNHMNDANAVNNERDALEAMMGAVKEISGNFEDAESLKNSDLYLDGKVKSQVDSYINAVKTLAGLSDSERQVLLGAPNNAIVVFITADGIITAYPGDAQAS